MLVICLYSNTLCIQYSITVYRYIRIYKYILSIYKVYIKHNTTFTCKDTLKMRNKKKCIRSQFVECLFLGEVSYKVYGKLYIYMLFFIQKSYVLL